MTTTLYEQPAAPRALPGDAEATRLFDLSTSFVVARSLWAFAKLGIADRIGEGSRASADLAAETGLHPGALRRLLRLLAGVGVVRQSERGQFALTTTGRLLRSDVPGSMRSWVAMTGGPIHATFENILFSLETGSPAFERTFGVPHYDYLREHPEDARDFNDSMTSYSARIGKALARVCDLSSCARLVDVGSGPGAIAASLLRANPGLRVTLFDLPHIAARARGHMEREELAERCEFAGGDFFEAVPGGGDAYLLGSILHNWDDERALSILSNCRSAAAPGAVVLVSEMLIADDDGLDFAKLTDVVGLTAFGGRERTADEYTELLERAGLEPLGVVATESHVSLIRGRAV